VAPLSGAIPVSQAVQNEDPLDGLDLPASQASHRGVELMNWGEG